MKKNYIYTLLIACATLIFFSFEVSAEINTDIKYINKKTVSSYCGIEMPETSGKSVFVFNPESGFSIYEKNSTAKIYPASTVKIMTAIIAYERIPDKSVSITIPESVIKKTTGLRLGLSANDVYTAEDLIRAVLICGSNDAANVLADYVTNGDIPRFVTMMNEKAVLLGCTNTNFCNVTGLHDPAMYTTAADLMKIAIYAYNLGEISDWSSTASHSFIPLNDPSNYKLRYNRNNFVSRNNTTAHYYKGAFGLNSGYTPEAGNCLITAAEKDNMTYICVIMNSDTDEDKDKNRTYEDAKQLLNKCFSSFTFKKVLSTDSVIAEVPVNMSASTDHIQLFPDSEISHLLPTEISENDLSYEKIIFKEEYSAPITKGTAYGEIIIKFKDDYIIGKSKLICKENIERSSILYTIEKMKDFFSGSFFIVTVITAVILFILYSVVSFRIRRKKHYWYK